MQFEPKVNEIYRHFKGNVYQIKALAEHTETGETLVVYQALYGEGKVYARPVEMFTSKVDRAKYPNVEQEYRFEKLDYGSGLQQSKPATFGTVSKTMVEQTQEVIAESQAEQEPVLDPLVEEFMDTDTYDGRLNILEAIHHRVTDEMLDTMAIVCDVELQGGSTEERYQSLKNCLLTLNKYEARRPW